MGRKSKRIRQIATQINLQEVVGLERAIELLKACPPVKFDQTVEVSLKLGVDPRKSDQQVRGTVSLPKGTGKRIRVLVFARGEKVQEALDAGADYAGSDELLKQVAEGWTDFDAVVATPEMMREVGKLGKVLGPRGLMPTPKAGNVTAEVATAVQEIKGGKVEFKADRSGVVNGAVGKLSFAVADLLANISSFISAVMKAKPASAKGVYLKGVVLSSTMGPGLKITPSEFTAS